MIGLTRNQFLIVAVMLVAGAVYLMNGYRRAMFVENSQDYRLILFDRPLEPTADTKNVYLTIERNGEVLTDGMRLYQADFFDREFSELYPKPVWISPSVFALDGETKEDASILSLENKRSTMVDYLVIETAFNKFIVVGLEPGKTLSFKMNYDYLMSVKDANFKDHLVLLIRKEDKRNYRFDAVIDDDGIKLSHRNVAVPAEGLVPDGSIHVNIDDFVPTPPK